MSFFNKKEDVFHIELTPYGRYLMSIGKLMPHHYKFFDDDVIYDPYAISSNTTEMPHEAHQRIVNETPKLKLNPNVTGVETGIALLKSVNPEIGIDLNNNREDPLDDNINFLQRELGSSKNSSNMSIATKVELFRGELTDSSDLPVSKFLNSQNTQNLNIPQINIQVAYKYKVDSTENVAGTSYADGTYFSSPYDDGNLYVVTPNDPIIRFKEENALDYKENWEIRAYLVELGSAGGQYYKPLNFLHRPKIIQNGLLVDEVEDDNLENSTQLTPEYVEYYFNLNVDNTRVGFDDLEDCD